MSYHEKTLDIIFGRWKSQILYAGVKLGIFDCVNSVPKKASEIAKQLDLDSSLAYRLLRALGSLDLLREDAKRCFSLTEQGELLGKDHPRTLRGITLLEEGTEHYAIWKHLPAMITDGKQDAFLREYGKKLFEYSESSPHYREVFNQAMSSYSRIQTGWILEALDGYDFSKIRHICDVGEDKVTYFVAYLSNIPGLQGLCWS